MTLDQEFDYVYRLRTLITPTDCCQFKMVVLDHIIRTKSHILTAAITHIYKPTIWRTSLRQVSTGVVFFPLHAIVLVVLTCMETDIV